MRDQLPEGPGIVNELDLTVASDGVSVPPPRPRLRLLVTERIKTAANRFGLSRLYKRRPVQDPDPSIDLETVYAPTAAQKTAARVPRTIQQILAPYPNLSSFLFGGHQHWLGGQKKTQKDRKQLQQLLLHPEFNAADIRDVNFDKLDDELVSPDLEAPWVRDKADWHAASVTIGVPPLKRPNQASRRQAAADQRRTARTEGVDIIAASQPIEGEPTTIPGLWYKDICTEIRNTFEHDDAAKTFVFDPHLMYASRPGSEEPPEAVYSEVYHSQAFVDEDVRLQNAPSEPGCDLPRAIVAMMWWSDATHVTQFGNSKVWPAYMYYGNQTKYERSRSSCHAARHMAYFPTVCADNTATNFN